MPAAATPQPPAVVLDTNTVLDWMVFEDPGATNIAAAIEGGRVRWLACARMRNELERVLGYPALMAWRPVSERTLHRFDQWAHLQLGPPPAPRTIRCTDLDDQVFIDLALACSARWLLSHDRAVLRLARRCGVLGLTIQKPGQWCE